jgi:hypothetical protein
VTVDSGAGVDVAPAAGVAVKAPDVGVGGPRGVLSGVGVPVVVAAGVLVGPAPAPGLGVPRVSTPQEMETMRRRVRAGVRKVFFTGTRSGRHQIYAD